LGGATVLGDSRTSGGHLGTPLFKEFINYPRTTVFDLRVLNPQRQDWGWDCMRVLLIEDDSTTAQSMS
jgi:hypothetical protein